MTFKTPAPSAYFSSLLIAAALATLIFWILHTQNLTNDSLVTLIVGLLIGHLIAACTQPSATKTKSTSNSVSRSASAAENLSLYVGNLAYRVQRDELRELFAPYGNVNSVRIMIDRATRRPRGYAFVEMERSDALEAIKQLDNTEFCGRTLRVSEAKQKQ